MEVNYRNRHKLLIHRWPVTLFIAINKIAFTSCSSQDSIQNVIGTIALEESTKIEFKFSALLVGEYSCGFTFL